jgi:hypothetical protein
VKDHEFLVLARQLSAGLGHAENTVVPHLVGWR